MTHNSNVTTLNDTHSNVTTLNDTHNSNVTTLKHTLVM